MNLSGEGKNRYDLKVYRIGEIVVRVLHSLGGIES